jgi:hypothetical protein
VLILVSGSSRTVRRLLDSGVPNLGQLVTPGNHNAVMAGVKWGMDNGAFSGFDPLSFRRRLARDVHARERCLFAVCPDVVGDARATLALFGQWRDEVAAAGYPIAFVGQDGAESTDVPWDRLDAWFVGGSTAWKLSLASADLIGEARRRGKWCHVGRVNSLRRLRWCVEAGANSCDGSSMSMFGDKYVGRFCAWSRLAHEQGLLF